MRHDPGLLVASAPTFEAATLESWLVLEIAASTSLSPEEVDPTRPLAELGLDSAAIVELSGRMEEKLGVGGDPTLLFDYPTIRSLVNHLASAGAQ